MYKKITYRTAYDSTDRICGYVFAEERQTFFGEEYYVISKEQYRRCLKHRTVGGCAGILFDTDKPVRVIGIDIER